MQNFKVLSNGLKMPIIGLGVWQIKDHKKCKEIVKQAIALGYRLIDTAEIYGNEAAVGEAIAESNINRNELFITTKVWFGNGDGYARAKEQIQISLHKLQTNYIDLVLIHQPVGDYYGAYKALEEYYKKGVIKAIGVSNFAPDRLTDICIHANIKPHVNQIELHPYYQRKQDLIWNAKYNVVIEAWSPLAQAKKRILKNHKLKKIAKAYNKSVAQVILRWLVQQNIPCLPKTVHEDRLKENLDIFDFTLTEKDMKKISKLDHKKTLFFDTHTPEGVEYICEGTTLPKK